MEMRFLRDGRIGVGAALKPVMLLLGCSVPFLALVSQAQERSSLAGEKAAENLKAANEAEAKSYNLHYGPVDFRLGGGVLFGYTDNVFYSETNRQDDFMIDPHVDFTGFMRVSEINALRLSVDVGYEYYLNNHVLNADAPMVNPNTEMSFNIFVSNFHIQLHEKFSYLETLFINTSPSQSLLFNFNNVSGTFVRWDNLAGFNMDWDLDRVIITASYDHETFQSSTADFEYLNRSSELMTGSAGLLLGDHFKVGPEIRASWNDYDSETTLNDNWRTKVGPFMEAQLPWNITLRAGGGNDSAAFDHAGAASDLETYYAYGTASQETRVFKHSLSAGRESSLGDNANNLEDIYVRYAISTPIMEHVDLGADGAVHIDKEYGGAGGFSEDYTYYVAGLRAGYQLHKYWRADVGYEYLLKDSNLPERTFHRNQVTVGLTFSL
jgi:hypothetical protein